MGYIPGDARWYLADLVMEHRIENEPLNVVHVNTHLVEAGSPETAYEKAMALGHRAEHEYENTDGMVIRVVFRGLRDLNVIHEPLEDGSEIMYSEDVGVSEDRLRGWVKLKERLGVFAPFEAKTPGPNYLAAEFGSLIRRHELGHPGGS